MLQGHVVIHIHRLLQAAHDRGRGRVVHDAAQGDCHLSQCSGSQDVMQRHHTNPVAKHPELHGSCVMSHGRLGQADAGRCLSILLFIACDPDPR